MYYFQFMYVILYVLFSVHVCYIICILFSSYMLLIIYYVFNYMCAIPPIYVNNSS